MKQDTWRVTHWLQVDHWRMRRAQHAAAKALPSDWMPFVEKEAAQAAGKAMGVYRQWFQNPQDAAGVYRKWGSEFGGAAAADLSDSEIKAVAQRFADDAQALDIGRTTHGAGDDWEGFKDGAWGELVRLIDFCEARSVHAPSVAFKLAGMAARVRCKYWWRRSLRKMVARLYERGAIGLGMVSQRSGQSYASNKAVFRRLDQNKRNTQALEATAMENEDGQRATLAELAARSVSNKAIRRGELMTRIRGCEEIADELGMPGVFLTLTCPSRFHSIKHTGKRNKKHDGSQPNEGQQWLCKMWARARAKLARQGVQVFGFRVAEPHHDACPHWHALFWARDQAAIELACEVIREYWLSEDGVELGASEHRVKAKRMDKGGAAGYIAKYIAKNIDDHQIDSHLDDYAGKSFEVGKDLLGDVEIKPCMRVEAWAATWGIRQFQPIGQPPVGVWRELRRVAESRARNAGVGGVVHKAWIAASGSWKGYVKAQGGMMRGRDCNIVVAKEKRELKGRYETAARQCVIGVRINTPGSRCIWSERKLWKVIEVGVGAGDFAGAKPTPRTRVNNCTHNRLRKHAVVHAAAERVLTGSLNSDIGTDFSRSMAAIRRSDLEKERRFANSS